MPHTEMRVLPTRAVLATTTRKYSRGSGRPQFGHGQVFVGLVELRSQGAPSKPALSTILPAASLGHLGRDTSVAGFTLFTRSGHIASPSDGQSADIQVCPAGGPCQWDIAAERHYGNEPDGGSGCAAWSRVRTDLAFCAVSGNPAPGRGPAGCLRPQPGRAEGRVGRAVRSVSAGSAVAPALGRAVGACAARAGGRRSSRR
jgi:hypothetical protein